MTTTYRAAVLDAPRHTSTVELRTPPLGERQVRVRLEGCGVCASNIPVWQGRSWFRYPLPAGAPGHEGWGIVEAVGANVQRLGVGQRVAFMSDHAYAEYDVADEAATVALPDALQHLPFPGEPLACAMNIFERSDIRGGQRVAIVGAGFLGLLLTQLAARHDAYVVVISRREYALQRAHDLGADATIRADGDEVQQALRLSDNKGFDRVIEAVGEQRTLTVAGELTAEHGRLIVAGYHQDGLRQVNMQQWNWRGIDVINAHERRLSRYVQGMQRAIDAVTSGQLDPFALLTHSVPLAGLNDAFVLATTRPPGFVKAVLKFA